MQQFIPLFGALLVVSTATLAEPPPADAPAMGSMFDVNSLLAQAATPRRETQRAPNDQEALALAALEGLMAQPAERSLPILKKVLSGSQSTLVKQRAIFVLSQIDAPEAQSILLQTAKSADSPLRAEAIRNIGIGGNAQSIAALREIYNSGDDTVKQRVMEAWLIAGSKDEVMQVALNAKTERDASAAIRTLGAMGAADELRKLGELKKPGQDLVEAFAISGDLASLRKVVTSDADLSTRADAVRKIGIVDSDAARSALREIYTSATAPEIKQAALEGMLISDDEAGVLSLYRGSKNADEKRDLLRTLSHMNGDAALEAIDAALEGKQ